VSVYHSFDVEHAKLYGMREAVLVSNFQFWIGHNYANDLHFYDGKTWTYNSVEAFETLFPYLTYKQIRSSLDALISMGVLLRGNYNRNPTDRTCWYAFSDDFLEKNPLPNRRKSAPKAPKKKGVLASKDGAPICPVGQMEMPNGANGIAQEGSSTFAQEGKSLIDTDIKPDSKHTDGESAGAQDGFAPSADAGFSQSGVDESGEESGEAQAPARPSMATAVCVALKSIGMASVNPGNEKLQILLRSGADIGTFVEVGRDCVKNSKPFAYLLATVAGRMKDAAAIAATAMAAPQQAASRYQPAPPRYAGAGAAIFGGQAQTQDQDAWRTVDAQ
jgi:hypothetical protein